MIRTTLTLRKFSTPDQTKRHGQFCHEHKIQLRLELRGRRFAEKGVICGYGPICEVGFS
jgi:hypothetical protein